MGNELDRCEVLAVGHQSFDKLARLHPIFE
jgi:hypothetical protein